MIGFTLVTLLGWLIVNCIGAILVVIVSIHLFCTWYFMLMYVNVIALFYSITFSVRISTIDRGYCFITVCLCMIIVVIEMGWEMIMGDI